MAGTGRVRPAGETADRPEVAGRADASRPDGTGGPVRLAEVARGGTLNLVGAAVAAVMTVGVTVVVTRHFSKYAAGSFFAATSAFLIVEMIATLGVQNGLVYFIARVPLTRRGSPDTGLAAGRPHSRGRGVRWHS